MAELNAQVVASADDGDWVSTTFTNNAPTIRAGKTAPGANHAFARFTNIEVNGTITNAYVSVRASVNFSNTVPIRIYAELAADPSAPSSASDANGRTLTTAFVDWSPGAWSSGTYYDSPDLSDLIQELVDAYTYTGSQAIIIYLMDNGAASGENRGFRTYDHNTTASPPKLYVEYTPANDPPTIVANTPDEEVFGSTVTLEFTGDDEDDLQYEIRVSTSPDFLDGIQITDSFSGGGGGSFHPQPHSSATSWNGQIHVDDRMGQAFASVGLLNKIVVTLGDSRPETSGTAYIRVYAHQGTFGTSSEPLDAADAADTPTPNWLAISDGVALGASFSSGDYEFNFSGANRIRLQAGTYYVFILDWVPDDRDTENTWAVSGDVLNSGTLHPGNLYNDGFSGANNGARSGWDLWFEVHTENDLIEAASDTDEGFTNTVSGGDTPPFNGGEKIAYTVPGSLTNGVTYYWQVRAIDEGGSNIWSNWTEVRSFTVTESDGVTVACAAGALTLSGQAILVAPGGVSILGVTGALSLAGQTAVVAPGGVNVQTAVGTLTITGVNVVVLSGGSLIEVTPGILSLAGQTAGVLPGEAIVLTAAGGLAISGPTAVVLPGAVAVAVAAGVLQVSGLPLASIGEAAFAALGRPFAADEIARFFAQGVMTFDAQGVMTFVAI